MNSDKNISRVYDLAEQFEFKDLLSEDKDYVLSFMKEDEYNDLRKTIQDLPNYFVSDIEPITNIPFIDNIRGKIRFTKFIQYPLRLYKVAVLILIAYFLFNLNRHFYNKSNQTFLTQNDTVYIHKTDTISRIIHDTVWVEGQNNYSPVINKTEMEIDQTMYNDYNFNPDEVEKIMSMTNNNSLANDSILKSILVLLN
ncbi:MAG: hypothetical protein PHX13_12780 [Thiovulaceae bacterium]|nr:hypothetical protein [Sulfurimonadaceae bacterium]